MTKGFKKSGHYRRLIGTKMGRWTIEEVHYKGKWPYFWARCECGNRRSVFVEAMLKGLSTQCRMCYNKTHGERTREAFRKKKKKNG